MKSLHFLLSFILLGSFLSSDCFSQVSADYSNHIDTAKKLFQENRYIKSAEYYSRAFLSNHNKGLTHDRYSAARSWALGGKNDSAFYHLDRSIIANYNKYEEISADTAFTNLKADKRWVQILEKVRLNRQKQDEYLNLKFKHLNRSLVAILDTIEQDDQLPRVKIAEIEKKYGWSSDQMRINSALIKRNDSLNIIKIKYFLDKYGWLGKDEIGEHGNNTLFLVIQHADLTTQQHYLPLLRGAVKQGKAKPACLALLEDRVAVRQGKKQVYGSQIMHNNTNGKYFVLPLINPRNVDKRRAKVGLPSIKEYVNQWGINWSIQQYKKDLPKDKIIRIQ